MKNLLDVRFFLLDMDGTFYLGNKLIPGALEFLQILKDTNRDFVFLTNNSSKNKFTYKQKLSKLGCNICEEKVFTSGEAAVIYLKNKKSNAKIFLMGTPSLEEEFMQNGFTVIKDRSETPDYVVLGFDTTLTYEKIWIACDLIREGIPYIATHPDFNCPIENKKYMPDTGAMIKLFEAATGRLPLIIGKPYKYIIDSVMQKYRINKEELAIVGDRLYTDIATGVNSGITSILVFTGETSEEMYKKSNIKADYVFSSIKDLGNSISNLNLKIC
ncbi:HAD-IIA family hydrolase [Clostridium lundense]|uniref:HAD-IIA family hydrolase n=1 Tax=Clostridium lundense TaxID=319475 RepID=UPI00047F2493|nr:HAD-IIA family hydrolase [Clostridium lundense]